MQNQEKTTLIQRWDTVLQEIEKRFFELVNDAKSQSEIFTEQILYDSAALENAWRGVESEMDKLKNRSETIWNTHMDELFVMREDVTSEDRDEQYYKRIDLNLKMDSAFIKAKTYALAEAGRKIYENVCTVLDTEKKYNCTQCSAPLDIPFFSFTAHNKKCDACGTVNSYDPDSRMVKLEFYYAHPIANEKVIDLYIQAKKIELDLFKINEQVNPAEYEKLTNEYKNIKTEEITNFYDFLIQMIPEKLSYYTTQKERQLQDI